MRLHDIAKKSYVGFKNLTSRSLARRLKLYLHVAETEAATWSTWFSMPLLTRLWLWRRGFHSPEYVLYDFNQYNPEDYISGVQRRLAGEINSPWGVMVGNKLAFFWMMTPFAEHRTDVYGIVDGERFHRFEGVSVGDSVSDHLSPDRAVPSDEWLIDALRDAGALVLKPVAGGGGKSVIVCDFDGENYHWSGESISERELRRNFVSLSDFLVCEHIEQTDLANELYPNAVSTIRIFTFWDEEAGEPFIPMASYRIATDKSAPVDNFSAGSLQAEVDRSSGTLGEAVQFPFSGTLDWHSDHPDTGARIEGRTIPQWDTIQEGILDIADYYSHIPYLGWDVVPTSDSGFKVIEANGCPGVRLQVHRPLLVNDRTRAFYERHGIV